jgi:hypothetical protein
MIYTKEKCEEIGLWVPLPMILYTDNESLITVTEKGNIGIPRR